MTNLFIPQKLKVGYRNREDTFTGKLAYVIYYDEKNILRKETSWKNWCDSNIPSNEFDNTPLRGFTLNKSVGGRKTSWNYRRSYCRIWDPRGFEVEITIENLLWILDYCECTKGKVLDGEFVYSWEDSGLVLLPVCTEEYKASKIISDRKYSKSGYKSKELIPGTLYRLKTVDWYLRRLSRRLYDKKEAVFIGLVKVQKSFGKYFETKAMFYLKVDRDHIYPSGTDVVFFATPGNIDYDVMDDYLDTNQIDNIIHRFELTAYSYYFWNNNIISKLYSVDKNDPRNKKCVKLDPVNNIIEYYRDYYSFTENKSYPWIFHTYSSTAKSYLFCKFKLDNNNLKLIDTLNGPGELDKSVVEVTDGRVRALNSGCLDKTKVYPDLKNVNWDDIEWFKESGSTNQIPGELSYVRYETIDGYISDSLNNIFKMNLGFTKSNILTEDVNCVVLPER